MNLASEGKINDKGYIFSEELITEKQGYEAMLYMLKSYYEATNSTDLTDILSGGGYWGEANRPMDSAYWEYWLESVQKVREVGPPINKV
jgi:hypothetical protein